MSRCVCLSGPIKTFCYFYQWHLLFISDMSADPFRVWITLELMKHHSERFFTSKRDRMTEMMTDLEMVRIPIQAIHSCVIYVFIFTYLNHNVMSASVGGGTNSVGISNTQTFPITDWVNSVWSCRRQNSCLLSTFECHYFICTGLMYWELGVTWIQGYHVWKRWDTACRREWGNVCQFLL